jgi:hypothetical protein
VIQFFHRSFNADRIAKLRRQSLLLILTGLTTLSMLAVNTASVDARVSPTGTPMAVDVTVPDSGEPVILQPGNSARLVSPLKLKLISKPGEDGLIRIELIGQDNRLIFRRLLDYTAYQGKTLLIEHEIPFEVRDDENARLQVILEDRKGKATFLDSIQLTLLKIKGSETIGASPVNPRIKMEMPQPGSSVRGSELVIKAGLKPINDTPVVVEVLASDWHTLTSKILKISIPIDQTAFTPIEVKLPFKTGSKLPVTIRIRQESNTLITGPVLMWSEKVTLTP